MLVEFLDSPNQAEYPECLIEWILDNGMNNANESTWDRMLETYLDQWPLEVTDFLGAVKNLTLVEKYLNMTIAEDSPFLNEYRKDILEPLFYSEPAISTLTTDFVMSHWDEFACCNVSSNKNRDYLSNEVPPVVTLPNGTSDKYMTRVLSGLMIEGAKNFDQLRKVKTFLEERQVSSNRTSERINIKEADLEFAQRFFEEFRAWQNSKESNAA